MGQHPASCLSLLHSPPALLQAPTHPSLPEPRPLLPASALLGGYAQPEGGRQAWGDPGHPAAPALGLTLLAEPESAGRQVVAAGGRAPLSATKHLQLDPPAPLHSAPPPPPGAQTGARTLHPAHPHPQFHPQPHTPSCLPTLKLPLHGRKASWSYPGRCQFVLSDQASPLPGSLPGTPLSQSPEGPAVPQLSPSVRVLVAWPPHLHRGVVTSARRPEEALRHRCGGPHALTGRENLSEAHHTLGTPGHSYLESPPPKARPVTGTQA